MVPNIELALKYICVNCWQVLVKISKFSIFVGIEWILLVHNGLKVNSYQNSRLNLLSKLWLERLLLHISWCYKYTSTKWKELRTGFNPLWVASYELCFPPWRERWCECETSLWLGWFNLELWRSCTRFGAHYVYLHGNICLEMAAKFWNWFLYG